MTKRLSKKASHGPKTVYQLERMTPTARAEYLRKRSAIAKARTFIKRSPNS